MADQVRQLLDQFGEPVRTPLRAMTSEVAPVGAQYARPPFAGHVAFGLTPDQLGTVVRASDNGNTLGFMQLAEEIEELYPHYAAVLSKRKRGVCQLPITVAAASDAPSHKVQAEFVRAWLGSGCLQKALYDICDAIGKGYSVCEIVWEVTDLGMRPKELLWRSQRFFEISWEDGNTLWLRTEAGYADLLAHKFLIHRHPYKSGLMIRSGLARSVVFLWMYAAYTQRDWALFSQGYGLPMRVGRYGPEASNDDKRTLWRAVSSIAGDVAAIIPKSMEIDFVEAKAGSTSTDLYLKRADWLDHAVSKLVLGATAGTDAIAGGHAVGKEHRQVEEDVERFDAGLIATTISDQLVRQMIDFTFGRQEKYPLIHIGRPDETPLAEVIAAVGDLASLGLKVKASEIRDRLQLSAPQEGDEVIGGTPAPATPLPRPSLPLPTGMPTLRSLQSSRLLGSLLTRQSEQAPEAVGALTDHLAEEAAGALAGLTAQVRAQFEEASDLTDLAERLTKLHLDSEAFGEAMSRGLALANMLGRAELCAELGLPGRPERHAATRDDLADRDFAVPEKRKLRIDDATHVRLAWDMVDNTDELTSAERRRARRRILRRAAQLGIDTADWKQTK